MAVAAVVRQVDLDKLDDVVHREAVLEHVKSFGNTPTQLFSAAHPVRRRRPDPHDLLVPELCARLQSSDTRVVAHEVRPRGGGVR